MSEGDFVLDASIALAWCFADEATPLTIHLLDQLATSCAFVPSLWPLEMGNILVAAERKKRISYANITQCLQLLSQMNIVTDRETAERGFREIIGLAHSNALTTYDAAYLELALRLGLPLATKDHILQQAAIRLGVQVLHTIHQ